MNTFFTALLIGVVAGVIDVIPMLIQKLDKYSCISAFAHWVILGMIIPFLDWNLQPWFKGMSIAVLTAIPIMIFIFPQDRKAIIPMLLFSILLGAGVGLAGSKFIG